MGLNGYRAQRASKAKTFKQGLVPEEAQITNQKSQKIMNILEIIPTHLAIEVVAFQALKTPISEILARVIKLACRLAIIIKLALINQRVD